MFQLPSLGELANPFLAKPLEPADLQPYRIPILDTNENSDPITSHLHLQRVGYASPARLAPRSSPLDAPPAGDPAAHAGDLAEAQDDDDFWGKAVEDAPSVPQPASRVLTWDALRSGHPEPGYTSPFVSEASSSVWEADLARLAVAGSPASTPVLRETLVENLLTVALGLESPLFAWDAVAERFDWRQDVKVQGATRIVGRLWGSSHEASASLIEPFLRIGSCLVRLEAVVKLLTSTSSEIKRSFSTDEAAATSRASHAVATSLSTVVHWSRAEIAKLEPPPPTSSSTTSVGLIALSNHLEPLSTISTTLADLFQRPITSFPPYAALPPTSAKLLSHLYNHLRYHLEYSLTPPLVNQAVVAWLLHDALKGWWSRWEDWVGGAAGSGWDDIGIETRPESHRTTELSRDEMVLEEEEAVTYILKPAALPIFFPRRIAIELFEAGRSLRLLRRSKPDHPVCQQSRFPGGGRGLLWSGGEATTYLAGMLLHAALTRRSIASWRLGRPVALKTKVAELGGKEARHEERVCALLPSKYDPEIAGAFRLFDLAPGRLATGTESPSRWRWCADLEEDSMLAFLARVLPTPRAHTILPPATPSLDVLADASLFGPLRTLGRLPSTSLLTLFFADLSLQTHLSILHSYLLLGDQSFARRLREALFSPPEEREGASFRRRRRRDQVKYGDDRGELGEERLNWGSGLGIHLNDRSAWPPGGAELSLVLRTVLDDSLEEARNNRTTKEPRTERERQRQVRDEAIWNDLDASLSFAYRDGEDADEEARWSDAQSLSALDFLIVDYKAPSPLNLVITPSILSKYNRVFSYLLRLTRIEAVARGIWTDITKPNLTPSPTGRVPAGQRAPVLLDSDRATQRALQSLAFEVRGLVGGISDFAFGTIQATHTTFRRAVDKVERVSKARERRETVDDDDADDDDDREPAWNLDSLMSLHAHFLDRILESLFVRGPNEHLRRTIDDGVFGVVLRLGRKTKEWRRREGRPEWDVATVQRDIRAMHHRLRSEATTLVKALQVLEGQGGIGSPVVASTKGSKAARSGGLEIALDRGAGSAEELLVRLDANQFYSGPWGAALGRLR